MTAYPDFMDEIIMLSRKADAPALGAALSALSVPSVDAELADWKRFAGELLALIRQHRDLGRDWKLNEAQIDTLRDFFTANEILVRCLEVASVSPDMRQAILEGLLAPPRQGWQRMRARIERMGGRDKMVCRGTE